MKPPAPLASAFTCAALLTMAALAFGQVGTPPTVTGLLEQAERASQALRFDAATAAADEALALAQRDDDHRGLARATLVKGTVLRASGHSKDAVAWLERAMAQAEALGDDALVARAASSLAVAFTDLGDRARAGPLAARVLQIHEGSGNDYGRAMALLAVASAEGNRPVNDTRVAEALGIAARIGADDVTAYGLKLKGGAEFQAGDLAAAEASLRQSVAAYDRAADIAGSAAARLMLGRVRRAHGDHAGALRYYQQAVDLLAPTGERYNLVEAVNATGVALNALGRHQDATAAYERGLALARESGNPRLVEFMRGNLGGGLVMSGDYARAVPVLEEVLAKNPEPYIAGYRHNQLAIALAATGREAEALPHADASVRASRERKQTEGLDDRLLARARILSALDRNADALDDLREATGLIEQVRGNLLPVDFLKRGYGNRSQRVYAASIDVLTRMGRNPEALELAEQGRARAFLDLLASRAAPRASSPVTATAGQPGLAARGGSDPGSRPGEAAELPSASAARALTLPEMGAVAARLGSSVIEYWVSEKSTVIWAVGAGGLLTTVRVEVTADRLAQLVARTKAAALAPARVRGPGEAAASAAETPADTEDLLALPMRGLKLASLASDNRAAWRELHRLLVEPVRGALPRRGSRLTIIPHGPLFLLSFAALTGPDRRYLLEDYELHYAPSVSALELTGRRRQASARTSGPWLLVGNPASMPVAGGAAPAPLPGTARELSAIAAMAPHRRVIRLEGAAASEADLARALDSDRPSLIHFSTHGFVLDDPATPPFLALNRTGADSSSDGRLTADEVYGLEMASDLVVLSACRSGIGQVSSDGVQGLTRAFLYAGSPSVAATFWDVADDAMARLMPGFYTLYARGGYKSASLRTAQLALLADLRAGRVSLIASGRRIVLPEHPLLWAGLFLVGEP